MADIEQTITIDASGITLQDVASVMRAYGVRLRMRTQGGLWHLTVSRKGASIMTSISQHPDTGVRGVMSLLRVLS